MGANLDKNSVSYGNPDYGEVDKLSRSLNISTASIEELRRKYLMYRGRNGKLTVHNYVIFYKEYVNLHANDLEIYKSFNAFDANRDGYLNFTELLTAIAWHTGVTRPNLMLYDEVPSY